VKPARHEIQLAFYRGYRDLGDAECKTSRWLGSAPELHQAMRSVSRRPSSATASNISPWIRQAWLG
jgi:hypothetical protein